MNLLRELQSYRDSDALPFNLSKRFVRALKTRERAELFNRLRAELLSAVDAGEASSRDLLTLCLRVSRVQQIRREKGEN